MTRGCESSTRTSIGKFALLSYCKHVGEIKRTLLGKFDGSLPFKPHSKCNVRVLRAIPDASNSTGVGNFFATSAMKFWQ
jgi:hypothetical protein